MHKKQILKKLAETSCYLVKQKQSWRLNSRWKDCFAPILVTKKERFFSEMSRQIDWDIFQLCLWQNKRYCKPKCELFLALSKWFMCLHLIRPSTYLWLTDMHNADVNSCEWVGGTCSRFRSCERRRLKMWKVSLSSPVVVIIIIMDANVALRQPVELQQFTEQLVWEALTQLSAQEPTQLAT